MPYARVWGDKKTRCRNSSSEACVRKVTVEKPNLRGPIKKGTGLHCRLSVHTPVLPRYQSQGPNKDFDAPRHIGRSWTSRQATGGTKAA
ncbi:hypothetical protein MCOR02_004128 [Pyricularia oryzae]|uniref:Uncharacterized protein n=2 Tax=Pyricularia TaxID=48558 RepID=A0ABQ8NBT5_PYRGI|nr:hypothetical protein MCOR01_005939 [Pyricularia oryzae]KAI6294586.1 hypothetical protein MCOR33_008337 [Pyricularia grisea]KAH9435176.1 hypothetical protein MCOR02_004128 [Pyricularia oryzae]KAI6324217.1 hypothetical protein MCOR29_004159 [Pyricularia oryzae]KAI6340630.1 hypothetical protein MCOR30_002438 [Pyricularia oryzae]